MHLIFRDSQDLDPAGGPVDLAQTPAPLVALSFSDSDLAALAQGWRGGDLPALRLARLSALAHPASVDVYVDQTLTVARGVLVRLLGGARAWAYGLRHLARLARLNGIALAVLPGDGRPDTALDEASTVPVDALRRMAALLDQGSPSGARAALAVLAQAAGLPAPEAPAPAALPPVGVWADGLTCPLADPPPPGVSRVALIFYRSYATAEDTAPIAALAAALRAQGHHSRALFVPSLQAPEAAGWLRRQLAAYAPDAIVNATAFSCPGGSPLDDAGVPVFQVALATAPRAAWAASDRGLSPADLAMHVVLPEVDGRLSGGVISFKEAGARDPDLQFAPIRHQPDPDRIAAVAARVTGWLRLARTPPAQRRLALVLSTYPGKDWNMAHAVGLDALASGAAIVDDLADAGYRVQPAPADLADRLAARPLRLPLADYRRALARLPARLRADLTAAWGAPEDDPAVQGDSFRLGAVRLGSAWVALQPDRDTAPDRQAGYHDLSRVPRHAYVAFYLWLQDQADALIHVGAHGTLEWLPGKAVALSADCWPEALTGALPVIYPFIVNDPGEAAQAKRRIGALTLGHLPPPPRASGTPAALTRLESLLDEFSVADGLDPARRDRLAADIRDEAAAQGLDRDLGLTPGLTTTEAIARIDRFVCDVKDSQFGDGLHIWGRARAEDADARACAAAEARALIDALDGWRIAPGPSGSPWRGRRDVLPTGRNLYTTDPRGLPSRAAHAQGVRLAEELIRRHLQDAGDWPRGVVVDLWGSATMRTAGEDFAMALHLIGVRPVWDGASARVTGFEVLALADLDRPRIDVTLRVSGLFRDAFPVLTALFAQAVRALAARDEAPDWNPYALAPGARVYGPQPGHYGLGIDTGPLTPAARDQAGRAWLAASGWALDGERAARDEAGLRARVAGAGAYVHSQDLPETDLLLASDYATHLGGFAAAQGVAGGQARLYHLDATDPARPRARALDEEIARVVRARAAHPGWIRGMTAHGFRGAAEIAATLDHMASFAHLAGAVGPHLFDAYHDATLGDPATEAFLRDVNPGAHAAMTARFRALRAAGLWDTRRNSIAALLLEDTP